MPIPRSGDINGAIGAPHYYHTYKGDETRSVAKFNEQNKARIFNEVRDAYENLYAAEQSGDPDQIFAIKERIDKQYNPYPPLQTPTLSQSLFKDTIFPTMEKKGAVERALKALGERIVPQAQPIHNLIGQYGGTRRGRSNDEIMSEYFTDTSLPGERPQPRFNPRALQSKVAEDQYTPIIPRSQYPATGELSRHPYRTLPRSRTLTAAQIATRAARSARRAQEIIPIDIFNTSSNNPAPPAKSKFVLPPPAKSTSGNNSSNSRSISPPAIDISILPSTSTPSRSGSTTPTYSVSPTSSTPVRTGSFHGATSTASTSSSSSSKSSSKSSSLYSNGFTRAFNDKEEAEEVGKKLGPHKINKYPYGYEIIMNLTGKQPVFYNTKEALQVAVDEANGSYRPVFISEVGAFANEERKKSGHGLRRPAHNQAVNRGLGLRVSQIYGNKNARKNRMDILSGEIDAGNNSRKVAGNLARLRNF